jgi:hypothetical protein
LADKDNNFSWPTEEEFEALVSLVKHGKIKPIVDLLRAQNMNVHNCIYDTLESLDSWDNSLKWIITQTPMQSLKKREKVGRPSKKEIDHFHDFKMLLLAELVAKTQIKILDQQNRLAKKIELRNAVLAEENISAILRFKELGRTRQDALIKQAVQLLTKI